MKNIAALLPAVMLVVASVGCADDTKNTSVASDSTNAVITDPSAYAEDTEKIAAPAVTGDAEKNGEIYVLFTSDVHCGVDQGFGYAGLRQIRDSLEAQGYETILVDDGDAIQGEPVGTVSKGETIVELMNEVGYDVAIPGNHEFDYGMDRFLELAGKAEYTYISCNFNREGNLIFVPYVIKEAAGKKIAFVGVTTPKTLTSSTPLYFQNDKGEYVYGFMQDNSGKALYKAVQDAVDLARGEGADIAFVNGGGIRVSIEKGDITYGDIINVHPFGNMMCVIEVTGQQILDALEWGSKEAPGENGGFLQVSGLTYEIDTSIDTPCVADENSEFEKISGKRRVKNVMVGDTPIDPAAKYTLAGHDYMLLNHGDGFTMFEGAPVLQDRVKIDNQVLIDYITDTLGGVIDDSYSDPFGQGRITITE